MKLKKITSLALAGVMTVSCFFSGGFTSQAETSLDELKDGVGTIHHFEGKDLATYKEYSSVLETSTEEWATTAKARIDAAIAVLDSNSDGVADVDFYDDMQNFGEYYTAAAEPEKAFEAFPSSTTSESTASWQLVWGGLKAQTAQINSNINVTVQKLATTAYSLQQDSASGGGTSNSYSWQQYAPYHMEQYQASRADGTNAAKKVAFNTESNKNQTSVFNADDEAQSIRNVMTMRTNWASLNPTEVSYLENGEVVEKISGTYSMSNSSFKLIYDYVDKDNYACIKWVGNQDNAVELYVMKDGVATIATLDEPLISRGPYGTLKATDIYTASSVKFEMVWDEQASCYKLIFPEIKSATTRYGQVAEQPITIMLTKTSTGVARPLNNVYFSNSPKGGNGAHFTELRVNFRKENITPTTEQAQVLKNIAETTGWKAAEIETYRTWKSSLENVKGFGAYEAAYQRVSIAIEKLDAGVGFYDDMQNFGHYNSLALTPELINQKELSAGDPFPLDEDKQNTSAWQMIWGGLVPQTEIRTEFSAKLTNATDLAAVPYNLTNFAFQGYHVNRYQLSYFDETTQTNSVVGGDASKTQAREGYLGVAFNLVTQLISKKSTEDEAVTFLAQNNWASLKDDIIPDGKIIQKMRFVINQSVENNLTIDFITNYVNQNNYTAVVIRHNTIRYIKVENGKMTTLDHGDSILGNNFARGNGSWDANAMAAFENNTSNTIQKLPGFIVEVEWDNTRQCYLLRFPQLILKSAVTDFGLKAGDAFAIPLTAEYCVGSPSRQLEQVYVGSHKKLVYNQLQEVEVTYGDPYVAPSCTEHSFTEETVADEYLKSAATCTEAAVYYKNCANPNCDVSAEGSDETATFTSGSALGHLTGSANTSAWKNADGKHYKECGRNNGGTICEVHVDEGTCADNTDTAYDADEKDTTHHWQTCNVCGAMVGGKEEHAFPDATSNCTTCGQAQHTHTYTRQVETDATMKTAPTCNSYGTYYYTCTDCDLIDKSENAETFSGSQYNADNHGTNETELKSDAENGQHYNVCKGCNEEIVGSRADCVGTDWVQGDTTHYKNCSTCGQKITSTEGQHVYGNAGYTHVGKCTCGKDDPDGTKKAVDFRPYILGGKILQGDVADAQKLRIDIDFSDIDLADNSDVKIQYYGVAIAKKTTEVNVETLKNNVVSAFASSTLDGSVGVIAKDYTAGTALGYENDIMRVKINVDVAEFGKGVALVAFVKAEDGTYYWAENSFSGKSDSTVIEGLQDGFYVTSVLRVMKNVLKDSTETGYYSKLGDAVNSFYTTNPDNIINTTTYSSTDSVKTLIERLIGTSGSALDSATEAGAIVDAKTFMRYVFYYCYTPQS